MSIENLSHIGTFDLRTMVGYLQRRKAMKAKLKEYVSDETALTFEFNIDLKTAKIVAWKFKNEPELFINEINWRMHSRGNR